MKEFKLQFLFCFILAYQKEQGDLLVIGAYRDQKIISPKSKLVSEQICHKYLFQDSGNWSKANKQNWSIFLRGYQWIGGKNSGNLCHYCWGYCCTHLPPSQSAWQFYQSSAVKTGSFLGRRSKLNLFQRMEGPVPTISPIKVASTLGNKYRKPIALLA